MNKRILVATAVLAAFGLSGALTGCKKLDARDNLNKGVQAFKNAKYADAAQFFTKSIELDPTFETAKLYLATAYMNQYIPGANSPENNEMAQKALDAFLDVLK